MPADLSTTHPSAPFGDLDPHDTIDHYRAGGLESWSDAQLVAAAASVVAIPRRDPADSFVLHAPLELAARAALLPLVEPTARARARMRIVALAAGYARVEPVTAPPTDDGSEPSAASGGPTVEALAEAISTGDLVATDLGARAMAASMTSREVAAALAPVVLGRTAAAAHAPIFAYHLDRRDPAGGLTAELVRPLVRELARHPGQRVTWTDRWQPAPASDARGLDRTLSRFPRLGVPGVAFIHPLLMQVDAVGMADEHLGPLLGPAGIESSRMVLRVAARSMLEDDPSHAPYGWTHCLTLAQALIGTTAGTPHASLGLALAATSVASFRAALGATDLSLDRPWPVDGGSGEVSHLATAAACSHDAHVVKYVLACLDAARDDPAAGGLYLAAARRLLDVWEERGADPGDPLA